MSTRKKVKCIREVGEPVGDNGLECLSQGIQESDWPVGLGLGIVLVRLPKNDRDTLPEMRWTVSQSKTGIEELVESWEYGVQRLVEDSIRDAVCSGSLVWGSSTYCPFNFRFRDLGAYDGQYVVSSFDSRPFP